MVLLERENIIKGEEGQNYTSDNIAKIAISHYWQSRTPHPKRKVCLEMLMGTIAYSLKSTGTD